MQRMLAPTGRPVTMASRGMVAAPHSLAAQAGVWALQQGGNAVDAAVAASLVLAVVYPHMAGLGGNATAMVWHRGRDHPICLNGSGHSGYQAAAGFYRERGHDVMPTRGPLAACTVPGAVAAWGDLHARWGALSWEKLFEPAIYYADEGTAVSPNLACWLERERSVLERNARARDIFLPNGRVPGLGQPLVQKDLAGTLRTLADEGPRALYVGDLAAEIIHYLEEHGGLLTAQDLEDHHSDWVDPLSSDYRGRTVYEFPPSTQGLAALLILNLLSGYDMREMGDADASYFHTMAEAAKDVLADVDERIADPNFVMLPLGQLLSPEYAERRRALIMANRSRPLEEYAMGSLVHELGCPSAPLAAPGATAYVATADEGGMAVSLVESLHSAFGAGVVAGRSGILLGNSGAAFSLSGEDPNRLEPHKRPFLPLIPGLVCADGRPWLVFGTSGGIGGPQTHSALVTRTLDLGYNIQQAIEAPRWLYGRAEGDEAPALHIEGRVPDSVLRQLFEMGHDVRVAGDWSDMMGQAHGIVIDADHGVFHGGADPRGDGQAVGW